MLQEKKYLAKEESSSQGSGGFTSLNIYSKWREGKICLIIENFSELQRFLGSSNIFDLLSCSTSRELPGDVIHLPCMPRHRSYVPKGYLWCTPFQGYTGNLSRRHLSPPRVSELWQVISAVPSTQRCTQHKKKGWHKAIPLPQLRADNGTLPWENTLGVHYLSHQH